MNKVGNFMDDSAITAKVKAARWIMTTSRAPISLSKPIKVVTLSGFVESRSGRRGGESGERC